ncbi:MAG: hypothetical protein H8E31_13805 [Planctomycetes bacterium]|nr:hypothetical protein [Planctomycetota bacterium]
MSRLEAWFHQLANLLVGGTGLAYAWTLYLCQPEDEFALVNHAWQPVFHAGHLWAAPLLVFSAGMLWRHHGWRRLRQGGDAGRGSGIGLLATLWPMALSGYWLQTSVDLGWRRAWLVVHLASSGLWVLAYAGHQLRRRGEGDGAQL